MSTNSRVKVKPFNQQSDYPIARPTASILKQKKTTPDYSSMYKAISENGLPIHLFDLKQFYNLY